MKMPKARKRVLMGLKGASEPDLAMGKLMATQENQVSPLTDHGTIDGTDKTPGSDCYT